MANPIYLEGYAQLGRRYAGLTGTIGYRLIDASGVTVQPFTVVGVAETTIPGDYAVTLGGVRGLPLPAASWRGKVIWGTSTVDLAEEEIGPPPWLIPLPATVAADQPASLSVGGLATVYCSDEDILIRAGDDYSTLCPNSQIMAQGRDGVFDPATPWVLTSATVDFLLLGVHARQVIWLTQPSSAFSTAQYLVVDGVASGAVALRRPGKPPGAGQPPGLGGVAGVKFAVATFDPQIDDATFEANREYNINPDVPEQAPAALHNPRDLKQFCVLHVLKWASSVATKSSNSAIDIKHGEIAAELEETRQRLQVRWGPQGETAPASGAFGRITR